MADPVELTTDAEVLRRLGSDSVAVQYCSDAINPATYDATRMHDAIVDASAEIVMYAACQVEMGGMTNAERRTRFPDLASFAARLARIFFVRYASTGQGVPQSYENERAEIIAMCKSAQTRQGSLGHPDTPPASQKRMSANIDVDPNQNRFGNLDSWKRSGFC